MSDHNFDKILKNKLEAHQSAGDAQWARFQSFAANQADERFDAHVKSSLDQHLTSQAHNNWSLLSQRWENYISLKQHIRSVKLLELMALLLLTFGWSTSINKVTRQFAEQTSQDKPQTSIQNLQYTTVQEASTSYDNIKDTDPTTQVKGLITANTHENITEAESLLTVEKAGFRQNIISEEATDLQAPEVNTFAPQINSINQVTPEIKYTDNLPEIFTQQHVLRRSSTAPLISNFSNEIIPLAMLENERNQHSGIEMVVSFDNNIFLTPDDIEFNTSARRTEMYGYSAALLYSSRKNALEWQTGLSYTSLDKPWNFNMHYGSAYGWYAFTLTSLKYKMVSVPVNIKYHLIQNYDWSMYVSGGIRNNIIVHSDYTTSNTYLGGGAIPVNGEPAVPTDPVSPFEEARPFSDGVFQGGDWANNFFISTQFGIGIQRYISNNMAINFSTNYSVHLTNRSIGPNADKMNKYNIALGLKRIF